MNKINKFWNDTLKPGWEKINILTALLFGIVSLIISIRSCNQAQEIKDMGNLLNKQDTNIDLLKKIVHQNIDLINNYDSTQNLILQQTKLLSTQSKNYNLSTIPQINLDANPEFVYMDQIKKFGLLFQFKNFGIRPAYEFKAEIIIASISNEKLVYKMQAYGTFKEALKPNVIQQIISNEKFYESEFSSISNDRIVIKTSYRDQITKKLYTNITYGKIMLGTNSKQFVVFQIPIKEEILLNDFINKFKFINSI